MIYVAETLNSIGDQPIAGKANSSSRPWYTLEYDAFFEWVHTCRAPVKSELELLLYPVFLHCFLKLWTLESGNAAQQLLASYDKYFHGGQQLANRRIQDLKVLERIKHPDQLERCHPILAAANLPVHLSTCSYALLLHFLQPQRPGLLSIIVNERVAVQDQPFRHIEASTGPSTPSQPAISQDSSNQILTTQPFLQGLVRSGSFSFVADNELLEQSNSAEAAQKHAPSNLPAFLQRPDMTDPAFTQANQDKAAQDLANLAMVAPEDKERVLDLECQAKRNHAPAKKDCLAILGEYLAGRIVDLRGAGQKSPQRTDFLQVLLCFIGSLLSLMLTAGVSIWMAPGLSVPLLLAPLGATVAVLFGLLDTPAGQPRSIFVGTLMSCLIGCIVRVPLGHVLWVGGPLAVALSLSAMQLTGTIHPPGCGLALIVTLLSPSKPCSLYADGTAEPWWRLPNAWELRRTLDGTYGARIVQGLKLSTAAVVGTCIILLIAILVRWCQPKAKKYPSYW